jgi:signal transduction histidine kinase
MSEYSREALEMSDEMGYPMGKAHALMGVGISEYAKANYKNSVEYLNKSLTIFKDLDIRDKIAKCVNSIAMNYTAQGNHQLSMEYYQKALHIYEEISDKRGIIVCLSNIGITHSELGNLEKGLDYFFRGLELAKEIDRPSSLSQLWGNIGKTYYRLGEYPLGLEYMFKAIKKKKEVGDRLGLAYDYESVALIYVEQGDYDPALDYHFRSLKIKQELNDKRGIAYSYSNISYVYQKIEDYDESLKYQHKALNISEEIGDQVIIAQVLTNIGFNYEKRGEYEKSIEYFERGVEICKSINQFMVLSVLYNGLSFVYWELGESEKSIAYGEKSLELAQQVDAKKQIKEVSEKLYLNHKKLGNYEKALKYHILFKEISDKLIDEGKNRQLLEMEAKFDVETATKQAEIERLRNVELANALEELKRTQQQLVESKKMASLGNLVTGVAHEINTPVGIGITAISSLMGKTEAFVDCYNEDQISIDDLEEYLQRSYEISELILSNLQRTADLIQSFKQVSVDQSTEQKRRFNLKDYLKNVIATLAPKLKRQNISFDIQCDDALHVESYPGDFAQIFTNLILNSLTHGFVDKSSGEIRIRVQQIPKNSHLNIKYEDNGKGIPEAILPKIYDPFFTTNPQDGTGLGMHIVYNLITQKLNGEINCQSQAGNGVLFEIKLPVDWTVENQR